MTGVKTKKYLIDPLMEMSQYRNILNDIKKGNGAVSLGGHLNRKKFI